MVVGVVDSKVGYDMGASEVVVVGIVVAGECCVEFGECCRVAWLSAEIAVVGGACKVVVGIVVVDVGILLRCSQPCLPLTVCGWCRCWVVRSPMLRV